MWFPTKIFKITEFNNFFYKEDKLRSSVLSISIPMKAQTIIVTIIITTKSHKPIIVLRISRRSLLIARKKKSLLFCINLKILIIFKDSRNGPKGPLRQNEANIPSETWSPKFTKIMMMMNKSNF